MAEVYPRTWPAKTSTWPMPRGHLVSVAGSGHAHTRDVVAAGVSWTEQYKTFRATDPVALAWLNKVSRFYAQGTTVQIVPYSHQTALGTVTQGTSFSVNGASQTGTTLICDGVSPAAGTFREGDYLTIAGVPHVCFIDADATAAGGAVTFTIWPGIVVAPNDNATVVLNGYINARITGQPRFPVAENIDAYVGATVSFAEFLQ